MKIIVSCSLMALCLVASVSRASLSYSSVTNNSTNVVVSFTAGTGTWTVPSGVSSVGLLVVGGGGAGQGYGGGGGGGGFYSTSSYGVTPGFNLNVTVGAGGAGGSMRADDTKTYPNGSSAANGSNSVFDAVTAYGGLGGNWVWTSSGAGYGRGGTSGGNNQNSIGNLAADQPSNSYGSGSGVGVKGTAGTSAAGGAGLSSTISGATVYYGGGGGALVNGSGTDGGGKGGNPASAGVANRGGGGGAGWGVIGGAGGSGVVIVSYTIPEPGSLTLLGLLGSALLLRRKLRKV